MMLLVPFLALDHVFFAGWLEVSLCSRRVWVKLLEEEATSSPDSHMIWFSVAPVYMLIPKIKYNNGRDYI